MKIKTSILPCFATAVLLVACSGLLKEGNQAAPPSYPTATSHHLFLSDAAFGQAAIDKPAGLSGTPTIAGIFQIHPSDTPSKEETQSPIPEVNPVQIMPSGLITATVYQDRLDANWEVLSGTGMNFDLQASNEVHSGSAAISFHAEAGSGVEYASLFFTVSDQAQEAYPRDQVAMLSFWLYSGEEPLPLDQLAVAIVGSNEHSFWSADDQSVTVDDGLPVFSETRLYYLGFNFTIPAHTWAPVVLDLDKTLIYDPEYEYVTGFYLKTEANFSGALRIDDVSLLMRETASDPEGPATPPADSLRPGMTVTVRINTKEDVHPISELIYGVSGAPEDYTEDLRPTLMSWGGNASTRYNWEIGHAWNAGRDNFYRNGNYGITSGSASDDFVSQALEAGAEVRLTLPTLGWAAKDDDENTCSFPLPDGSCGDADGASCEEPGQIADPRQANVPTYLSTATGWLQHLFREQSFNIRFLAMDNEPERWGYTHYDVHPKCTTYDEILKQYQTYAGAAHRAAPQAELVGPVTSGWYYYWNSAAGEDDKEQHGNQEFIPWFLEQIRQNDQKQGWRSLHVLDLHYYPEQVYNDDADEDTAALRLRSTRLLWDKDYADESGTGEPVYLIPRMKALIEEYYPGTELGLSEWNWGADETMNGALAIADVLGIFGRENLYYAAYGEYPPPDSPGFYAFKMYTNFDDGGARFGDTSVSAISEDVDTLGSYAALDSATGNLHVMVVNKQVDESTEAKIELRSFTPDQTVTMYRLDATHPEGIVESSLNVAGEGFSVNLPPYSITLLVLQPGP